MEKTTSPYPHVGGCEHCRAAFVCNYCGASLTSQSQYGYVQRCTNGRCHHCHSQVCTPGGDTSPGHGYGNSPANVKHFAVTK